ncbi:UNVERIFIED_CONTAM: hypothetical protein K2H54_018243 [Gekko kuhli]
MEERSPPARPPFSAPQIPKDSLTLPQSVFEMCSLCSVPCMFFLMWSIGTKLLLRESALAPCQFGEATGAGGAGSQTRRDTEPVSCIRIQPQKHGVRSHGDESRFMKPLRDMCVAFFFFFYKNTFQFYQVTVVQ